MLSSLVPERVQQLVTKELWMTTDNHTCSKSLVVQDLISN